MADTYIPTAGIHIEDLPTTDTAKTTDGLIINSNNNTVNQISLGDLLADTDAKIQANTDLIDSFAANEYKTISAGDSYTFAHTSKNFAIIFFNYSATVYGMAMCRASRVVWIYQPSSTYVSITAEDNKTTITNNLGGALPTYIINV